MLNRVRDRVLLVYAIVVALNIGGWGWAIASFHANPAILAVAAVVYGLGLRHAIDADHIAAIDNVTRKLMRSGARPVAVGFYFALGHSALVILAVWLVASAATFLLRLNLFKGLGSIISTVASAGFLFAVAAMNITVFLSIYRSFREVRRGGVYVEEDLDILLNGRGLVARLLRPVFKLVTKSWHMFPLGALFGLGFDTATEVAMFGMAATQAAGGVTTWSIMSLPVLFAAGMALVDTTDGVVMLGMYQWAFVTPVRKLHYSMAITATSVLAALLVGGVEAMGLIRRWFDWNQGVWRAIAALNDNMNMMGMIIVGVFIATWAVSFGIGRVRQ